jgi:hypothetical protein
MSNQDHKEPCQTVESVGKELSSFKKLMIGFTTINSGLLILCFGLCVNAAVSTSQVAKENIAIITRLNNQEKKIDGAVQNATQALAVSGKAEAHIAWIREGLTEIKINMRNGTYNIQPKKVP